MKLSKIHSNWTFEDASAIYNQPLLELVYEAASIHREFHETSEVQVCTLLSVKTGGCPEDCGYCPQAARYNTDIAAQKLLSVDEVVLAAKRAKQAGSTRFCMGAAWRQVKDNADFERVLEMVRTVKSLDLETCATLGMITKDQAEKLRDAGLDYYNHNLDTSPEYYGEVITTRTYEDRLETLAVVRNSGMKVCCGGILGMGETEDDRIGLIQQLAMQDPPPESVPINTLIPVEGTPLADTPLLPWNQLVRAVAVCRILMPKSMVRLSAGRSNMTEEGQAMCFLAGANSIFLGDQLLTAPNRSKNSDVELFDMLDLEGINDAKTAQAIEV